VLPIDLEQPVVTPAPVTPAPTQPVVQPAPQPTVDTAVLGVTHTQPQVAAATLPRTGIPVLAMLLAGLLSMLSGAALLRRRQ
jgi:LPXTG-motif cell wall-anchored protein